MSGAGGSVSNKAEWAARYIERFGFSLVPLDGKRPIGEAWNADQNLIGSANGAREYWTRHPQRNIGACLEPSGLVSLDCDMASTPTIIGRAPRLEFGARAEFPLGRKAIVWPARVEGEKPLTILEFRAGRCQDVLPPSEHPDLKRPYRWLTPPRDGFPPLPDALLRLWLDFDSLRHRARNLCPWAAPEPAQENNYRGNCFRKHTGPSVIAAFNEAHDPIAILESHGYQRAGKRRWKSPLGHGVAGVVLLPSNKIFCHHTSDPLLGDERAHDAFDLFALFEHGGDTRAAVRAAAELLGMERRP